MTAILAQLGVLGVALALTVITVGVYTIALQFRSDATWFNDLAALRTRLTGTPRKRVRRVRPMAHNLWPVCEQGPRMWRWPLNTTRTTCALIWHHIAYRRGLTWSIMRIAWYPATGIGAAAAITGASDFSGD
jgi:hypothetical protein